MFATVKRIFLASIVILIVLTTGAWQSNASVSAERQNISIPETPLYPGLNWVSLGSSTQNIRTSITGDSIVLSGEGYETQQQFVSDLTIPADVLNYYSNEELAKSGWASYDSFDESDGIHYVFYHETGVYLSVAFLGCSNAPSSTCVAVWKSEQVKPASSASASTSEANPLESAALSTFGKKTPTNGATNLNPASIVLSWAAYSPTPDKYSYCVNEGSACEASDPDWTTTYNTSVTIKNLAYNKTYYWQVRAVTCVTCVPKTFVYADSGTAWTFKTKPASEVYVLGNAGVAGAVLNYTDGTAKTVTADSIGSYSIKLPVNWSGTITPSKSGYLFYPKSASFSNLTAAQTIQNFTAVPFYVISGNVGLAGITFSYTDGTPQSVVSDSSGNYSIVLPSGWNGTVTPSHACYTFSPPSRNYSSLTANQAAQNYTATFNPASGCANVNVKVGGSLQNNYAIPTGGRVTPTYPGVQTGPIKVSSSVPVFTSERALYGSYRTFNEVMGFPDNQLTTRYWFPWYDNKDMKTWILVGNPSASLTANVTIKIAGQTVYSQPLGPNGIATPTFGTTQNGPVEVISDNPIFTSERALYGAASSFNEVMGFPNNQLTTRYWFPWYDNKDMKSWILVGNPSTTLTANVTIKIAGQTVYSQPLGPNGIATPTFGTIQNGPVEVISDIPIFTSERSLYGPYGTFNEVMGFPNNQLTTRYWFPWYDNKDMWNWVLVGNPSTTLTANVTIKIAGQTVYTKQLGAGAIDTPMFGTIQNGPVEVLSDNPIFTSERALYGPASSFNEVMGFPHNQLTTDYWFTWYDGKDMSTWILVGKP